MALLAPAEVEAQAPVPEAVPRDREVPGSPIPEAKRGPDPDVERAVRERAASVMPEPGRTVVELGAEASEAKAAAGPVSVSLPEQARGEAAPSAVSVEVFDAKRSEFVGPGGFAFELRRADGKLDGAALNLEVDYSAFREAFGGDYGSRLMLVEYPACVLVTPEKDECSQGEVVDSTNDVKASVLRTTVRFDAERDDTEPTDRDGAEVPAEDDGVEEPTPDLEPGEGVGEEPVAPGDDDAGAGGDSEVEPTVPGSDVEGEAPAAGTLEDAQFARGRSRLVAQSGGSGGVYGVTSGVAGSQSTFGATSLSQQSRWSSGGSAGGFSYSYPIDVPAATVGPTPELALTYSSQAADGFTASENGQAGLIGAGWDLSGLGFIERRYRGCPDGGTGWVITDLCWQSQNATINLNGVSSELVPTNAAATTWKLESDPGWRVERKTGGHNDDNDDEYWVVTTPDGTQYWFGYGREVNTPHGATNSAWTVPVFANNSNEPCYTSNSQTSWCNQAWRWNLDRVVDLHGSYQTIYWAAETNRYGRHLLPSASTEYDRGGRPLRIDYSRRGGQHEPATQIVFVAAGRCLQSQSGQSCPAMTPANASSWPDVPIDLICTSTTNCPKHSPSFFNTERIDSIFTLTRDGGWSPTITTVDQFKLETAFPSPGDGTDPKLWLNTVQRIGHPNFFAPAYTGSPLASPKVEFDSVMLANRADTGGGSVPVTNVPRVAKVIEELGGEVIVSYGRPGYQCDASHIANYSAGNWHANNRYCFPVYFKPDGQPAGWSVNHKYVTTSVRLHDPTGSAPDQVTSYTYGAPAWAHNDDNVMPASAQTWSEYRGHATVISSDGVAVTHELFYRGMFGDKLPGGATRTTQITTETGITTNDDPKLTGSVREVRHLKDLATYDATIHTYSTPQTGSGAGMTANRVLETGVAGRRKDGSSWITTNTTTTYASGLYWQPTQVFAQGAAGTSDDRCTTYTYAQNPSKWLLDRVARETLDYNCASPYNRITDTFYDGSSVLGASPVDGMPTMVRRHETNDASGTYLQTRAGYDAYGRLTSMIDGEGNTTTTSYSPSNYSHTNSITTTQPGGHVTVVKFNRQQRNTESVDVRGQTTTRTYDSLGRVTSVRLPQDPTAHPSYKYFYTLSKSTASKVHTQQLNGTPGAYNYVSSFELVDSFGRTRETQTVSPGPTPDGRLVTATKYNAQGQISRTSTPYRAPGTAGAGLHNAANPPRESHLTYDHLGRQLADRLHSWGNYQQTEATNAYVGYRTLSKSPADRFQRTTTDVLGNTLKLEEFKELFPVDATTTTYAPTVDGQIASITDDPDGNASTTTGSSTTVYGYDWAGRRTGVNDPDAGASSTTYDDNGNIVTTTDAKNQVIHTTYDALNRPTHRRLNSDTGTLVASWTYYTSGPHKGLPQTTTTHHPDGNWVSTVDAYDIAGRPTSTSFTVPPTAGTGLDGTYVTTVDQYDAAGNPTKVTMPAAGGLPAEQLTTSYTSLGLPNTLTSTVAGTTTTLVAETAFHDRGQLAHRILGTGANQLQRSYTFDDLGRLATAKATFVGGATIAHDNYGYDADELITQIHDVTTGQRECFKYDHLRRLTDAWTTNVCATPETSTFGPTPYRQSFQYDRIGNMTTKVTNGSTTTFTPGPAAGNAGPHALAQAVIGSNTTAYAYDANGAMISETTGAQTTTYTWNEQRHLSEITTPQGTSEHIYGHDGLRLLRREPNGTGGYTTTLYLGGTELTRTQAGTVTARRTITHGGAQVAQRTNTGLTWLLTDPVGHNSLGIAAGTTTVERQRYLPFGETRTPANLGTDRGYLNKPLDTTGLIRADHRFYNPATSRFINPDPLVAPEQPQSLNGYAYSQNSPVTFVDPSGLWIDWGQIVKWTQAALDRLSGKPSGSIVAMVGHGPSRREADQARIRDQAIALWAGKPEIVSHAEGDLKDPGRAYTAGVAHENAQTIKWTWTKALVYLVGGGMLGLADGGGVLAALSCMEGEVGGCAETAINLGTGPLIGRLGRHLPIPSSATARVAVNRAGRAYPDVIDPRTGSAIPHPGSGLHRVPVSERVPWGAQERGAYIKQWYDRGFDTPAGGWSDYDIHHITPREYGGSNAFDNLVPVPRSVHQQEFNAWWRDYE